MQSFHTISRIIVPVLNQNDSVMFYDFALHLRINAVNCLGFYPEVISSFEITHNRNPKKSAYHKT